eukprot:3897520-Rhodomonas_salina.1
MVASRVERDPRAVCCYERPRQCPVLTSGMLVPVARSSLLPPSSRLLVRPLPPYALPILLRVSCYPPSRILLLTTSRILL